MQKCNTQTRLKELRTAKHITQDRLAEITGLNRVTIARWECTGRGMSLKSAMKIAAALGCTIDDLLPEDTEADSE